MHESLLNVAFTDAPAFWLVCPYDFTRRAPAIIDEARRSHPCVVGHEPFPPPARGGDDRPPHAQPLPEPPGEPVAMTFQPGHLAEVRRAVTVHAAAAGLPATRAGDLVVAVNELATNSLRHGGGRGVLKLWRDDDTLVCEVRDRGGSTTRSPAAGAPQRASTAVEACGSSTSCATSCRCDLRPPSPSSGCT